MALVSADSRIAELLGELHQLIKQTQVPEFRRIWGFAVSPQDPAFPFPDFRFFRFSPINPHVLRRALDKIAEIKSLLEERRIGTAARGRQNPAPLTAKKAGTQNLLEGDEQWILAEVLSYSHAANKRHTLSRRRIIPLPQWKTNPETDPEALFHKEQLVLALYPQTTCFYRALIHTPPQRVSDPKNHKIHPKNNPRKFTKIGKKNRVGK
ncbi:PREDICTED: SAGA-associated factor 29 homolog [Sturnus vulgaris]|uniref:SAGA-associated factor 29 homolog n=1 Tax=Sturnus vulgaris TaxID=9172 RepID=UPI00071A6171|nr:PREDICTED: SAGA-associated factor 29 homolog [Sturnus vulgaris]